MSTTAPSDSSSDPGEPGGEPYSPGPGDASRLRVTLSLETPETDLPLAGWLDHMLARVAAEAGVTDGQVHLCIVGDARMAELHRQHCGQSHSTDVLGFDLRDAQSDPIHGDIVICLDEAELQARHRGHDTRTEALLYAVHGLLHLLGHDDHDADSYDKMHRREDELLRRVGVGPVFHIDPCEAAK